MKRITVLLKPTDECNFRCQYCYHADTQYVTGRMSMQLFEEIVSKIASCYNFVHLTFHGGEPLIMGSDFYEKAFATIKKYSDNGVQWDLGIQTNGYFLDEKYCELFESNNCGISISYDGPGQLNRLRDRTEEVTENIIRLRNKGYKISLLGVVTKQNVQHLRVFYDFAKKHSCPCKLNPVFECGGAVGHNDFLISPEEFTAGLRDLLPVFLKDDTLDSFFVPFTSLVYSAVTDKPAPICENVGCLHKWLAITHDGFIYPCSRSYTNEYCLGNISDYSEIDEAFATDNFARLLKGAIERRNYCKNNCNYYHLCQGGCNNDSLLNGDLTRPANFKCKILKSIVPYIKDYLEAHKDEIRNKHVLDVIKRSSYGKHNDQRNM